MITVLQTDCVTNYVWSMLLHNELIGFLKPIEANDELYFVDKLLII